MTSRLGLAAALAAIAFTLGGCANLGAQRLPDDRLGFNEALRESDTDMVLANIVALRFGQSPSFLAVGSIVSQYERNGFFNPIPRVPPYGNDPAATLGAQAFLRETPTVTFTPVTGDRFVRSVLEPVPPQILLSMLASGWSVDCLFEVAVRSINGVRNGSRAPLFAQNGDPEFDEGLAALRRLQRDNKLSIRLIAHEKGFAAHAQVSRALNTEDLADIGVLQRDFRMTGAAFKGEVAIVSAEEAETPNELAIATRSMLEVLQLMSLGVDAKGDERFDADIPIRVHSGPKRPKAAYAAIHRAGRWYWIAADDPISQRTIMLAEVLMVVNAQGDGQKSPLITVPAG